VRSGPVRAPSQAEILQVDEYIASGADHSEGCELCREDRVRPVMSPVRTLLAGYERLRLLAVYGQFPSLAQQRKPIIGDLKSQDVSCIPSLIHASTPVPRKSLK